MIFFYLWRPITDDLFHQLANHSAFRRSFPFRKLYLPFGDNVLSYPAGQRKTTCLAETVVIDGRGMAV